MQFDNSVFPFILPFLLLLFGHFLGWLLGWGSSRFHLNIRDYTFFDLFVSLLFHFIQLLFSPGIGGLMNQYFFLIHFKKLPNVHSLENPLVLILCSSLAAVYLFFDVLGIALPYNFV